LSGSVEGVMSDHDSYSDFWLVIETFFLDRNASSRIPYISGNAE
jgi:hypothetical protein